MNSFSKKYGFAIFLSFFLFIEFSLNAQVSKLNSLIRDTTDYNFNRPVKFRAGIHFPFGAQPFLSAEIKLLNRITLNMQLGASYDGERATWVVTDPAELADSDKISISGFISPELRYYYYKPVGRTRKNDIRIRGFSGAYIAMKYFASTPSTKINSAARYSYENVSALQINLGAQCQFEKPYFAGVYAGVVTGKHSINPNRPNVIPLLQFGLTVGYTF